MAESYSRIQSRIAQLQRQAEGLRREEMAGVVKKIKVAIEAYGITVEDLFGDASRSARKAASPRSGAAGDETRYADGSGNTWGGRGPRPKWLREAIAGGRSVEEFATEPGGTADRGATSSAGRAAGRKRSAAGKTGKAGKAIAIKYRDGDDTWTGRGSQPRWLRTALGEGKTLDQFKV